MTTVGERSVSDLGSEEEELHQTLRTVDGSPARRRKRVSDDRVNEIEASRHFRYVGSPKSGDEDR